MDDGKSEQRNIKVSLNVLRIPANEREANIVAVYAAIINEKLIGAMGNIPDIILQIRSVIENINLDDEDDIAESLCLIREKIENSNEDSTNEHVTNILRIFSKKGKLTFKQIREDLAQSNEEIKNTLSLYD